MSCCVEQPWDGGEYGYTDGGPQLEGNAYDVPVWMDWRRSYPSCPMTGSRSIARSGCCWINMIILTEAIQILKATDETAEDWVITDNCCIAGYASGILPEPERMWVGTLTKTVTATDKCGNTTHDTQTLYVKPRSDFEVIFPADVLVDCADEGSLAADRTGAGYPEISDDDCELIGVTYSDERYDVTKAVIR